MKGMIEGKILEIQKESGKYFGEIFIESGFGTKEDIVSGLFIQAEEIIFEILHWEKGYFVFKEDAPLTPDIQHRPDKIPAW